MAWARCTGRPVARSFEVGANGFTVGAVEPVVIQPEQGGQYRFGSFSPEYDLSPDAQRLVMVKNRADAGTDVDGPSSIVLIQHWFEELERIAPAD